MSEKKPLTFFDFGPWGSSVNRPFPSAAIAPAPFNPFRPRNTRPASGGTGLLSQPPQLTSTIGSTASDGDQPTDTAMQHIHSELSLFAPATPTATAQSPPTSSGRGRGRGRGEFRGEEGRGCSEGREFRGGEVRGRGEGRGEFRGGRGRGGEGRGTPGPTLSASQFAPIVQAGVNPSGRSPAFTATPSRATITSTPKSSFTFTTAPFDHRSYLPSVGSVNQGTRSVKFISHEEEDGWSGIVQFQTITAQLECQRFSLEELRLSDYSHGASGKLNESIQVPAKATPQNQALATSNWEAGRPRMQLLKGSGVEIAVGPEQSLFSSENSCAIWALPKALVAHSSIVLKDACARPVQEGRESRITLPEDDPRIFGLFVEWMYYGYYITEAQIPATSGTTPCLDAQAWVLGDKLCSLGFKNYAMTRLHTGITNFAPKSVKPEDLSYACKNSAVGSKLRQLFIDFIATHFADSSRVEGTTEEWDQVLLKHTDARSFLLRGFRMSSSSNQHQFIKGKDVYMETEQEEQAACLRASNEQRVVLAKRDAEGTPVKREPMQT